MNQLLQLAIQDNIRAALHEDIMTGDLHQGLFPKNQITTAEIITREKSLMCGQPWVEALFGCLDKNLQCIWHVKEGEEIPANTRILTLRGCTRVILSGERAALNFLQTLMGTANQCLSFINIIRHTSTRLLDTRKTLPGLRYAQKYAIELAGGSNHRFGLWDAFMLKENHIQAAGGILKAVERARSIDSSRWIEIEVENFEELDIALTTGVERIMLDNFSPEDIQKAIEIRTNKGVHIPFEASGNIDKNTLLKYAETGIEFISTGAITKHIKAVDLSLRILS